MIRAPNHHILTCICFSVPEPTNAVIPVEPPDFGKLPVHPTCPWTWLEFLGLIMLGCVGTGFFLACYYCQRKLRWAAAN